jgi:hypothetical protein
MASCIIKDATSEILCAWRAKTAAPAGTDEARPSTALSDDMATFSKEIARHITELDQHHRP